MAIYYVTGRILRFDGSVIFDSHKDEPYEFKSPFSTWNDGFTGIYENSEGSQTYWLDGEMITKICEDVDGSKTYWINEKQVWPENTKI